MTIVQTNHAPAAIGPYSQAIICDGLIFTSGQIPCDPATGSVAGASIETQTEQVLKNLTALLEAADSGLDAVLKTTCFLANMADFPVFNQLYGQYFTHRPARSCIAAKALPKNVLVEIEAIAKIKEGSHGRSDA